MALPDRLLRAIAKVPAALWITVATLGAVAVGIFLVDWHEEMSAGDFFVGVGTLALALGTFWLARHAKRQTDSARKAIEDAERPYVVASPHADHPEGIMFETVANGLRFHYRLWNIGRGPPLVFKVSLREEDKRELIAFLTPRALAVDGVADFVADVEAHTSPLPKQFTMHIVYRDGSRRTYRTEQVLWRRKDCLILDPLFFDAKRLSKAEIKEITDELERQSAR